MFFLKMNSQLVFSENFTAPFTPSLSGWIVQNNSIPIGPTTWLQGNSSPSIGIQYSAYFGAQDDYYGVDFLSQGPTSGGISNFLITPTISLTNGAVFQFATRTTTTNMYPDRLQLLLSQGTGTGAIGTGTTTVGTFTTTLLDINPTQIISGYPLNWTVYTTTLSGITGTVTGRFAFRYFVNNSGANGPNGDYVGIDAVNYWLPCTQPTVAITASTYSVCVGGNATLTASGATSYTWSNGLTGVSTVISPTISGVYSVIGVDGSGCPNTQTVNITSLISPNISVSNATTCVGTPVLLTASGASTYSWMPGGQTTNTISAPGTAATYTVIGITSSCPTLTTTVNVATGPNLGISVFTPSNPVCNGTPVTFTATGATTYSWSTGATTPTIAVTPSVTTSYSVIGTTGSCTGTNVYNLFVYPTTTITSVITPTFTMGCPGMIFTVTASGASSYTETITQGTTVVTSNFGNPFWVTLDTTDIGKIYSVNVFGIDFNGCPTNSLVVTTFSVYPQPTVTAIANSTLVCQNATAGLTAFGAVSYSWTGPGTSTNNPYNWPATSLGLNQFTVTGTSTAGCQGTGTINIMVSPCTGIKYALGNNLINDPYPNPFNGEIKLNEFIGNVEIYNSIGQLAIKQKITSNERINTSELTSGIYFIKLISSEYNEQRIFKMIKE